MPNSAGHRTDFLIFTLSGPDLSAPSQSQSWLITFCLTLVWSLSDSHPHWFLRKAFLWYWKLPLNLNSGLWSFEIYFHYLLPFILINKFCLIKFCINFRSAICGYADVYSADFLALSGGIWPLKVAIYLWDPKILVAVLDVSKVPMR